MKALQRLVLIALLGLTRPATGVEIPSVHHPWGRFAPGSWQRLRVTTESFSSGAEKRVHVAEITTSLVGVLEDGVILTREVHSGGEVHRDEKVKYAWDGSRPNDTTREKYSLGEVDIEGKTYTCQTWVLTTQREKQKRVVKTWYCPDHSPFLLKHLIRVTGEDRHTVSTRVTRLALKKEIQNRQLDVWETQTFISKPTTATRMTSLHSPDIPGGLVFSSSESRDGQQGLSQRVVRELVAHRVVR